MKRIGILGGTFDPPHYAHLLMAEQAYNQLELDEIWFLLSYQPTHKAEAKTTAKDRVEMTKAAIEGNPAFHISTVEVERKEKSYTLQTMKMIKEDFPNHQFYFIIGGGDMLNIYRNGTI
ncbi:nicotinate-nucleotide adenylyltransferase [Gracilibacillus boraciitolerans JCM 21714]|uniref:nicotinate-nucleotide adenylyltransferase n=1 Tax=Gracilibacillus boraciitolerans JCM 21714 TaxID=1298598 RepID=W4VMV1_9BACI|nr:nicotinate-nucleotide adenylyltransferase [Gracilibacillus boraciitolerans JCM 21714]